MTLKKVFAMYDNTEIVKNATCIKCRNELAIKEKWISNALGMWHCGSKFNEGEQKILFVGKPHRANAQKNIELDEEEMAEDLFLNKKWAYWSYTKDIVTKYYNCSKNDAWDKISMTNIIKCTISDAQDNTTYSMKDYCIKQYGVFWQEVAIVKPQNIICYLGNSYDEFLADAAISKFLDVQSIKEVTNQQHSLKIGKKNCRWWHRDIILKNNHKIRFLIVNHPERMRKEEYVNSLINWLKDN